VTGITTPGQVARKRPLHACKSNRKITQVKILPDPFDDHEIGFVIMVGLMFYMEVTYEVPIFDRDGGGAGVFVFWVSRRSCGRHLSDPHPLCRWQMYTSG
jgi:hypothetical protein